MDGNASLKTTRSLRPMFDLPVGWEASAAHQDRAQQLIPGAAHTYAKGDDQYPYRMAPVIVRGQGSCVWDLDGNKYVEYGSGLRSITLGHGYRPVCDAAYRAMLGGTNFARPAALEAKVAEAMLALVPGMEMIKFAKHGSDATTAALKLARAHTGRSLVAVCADHPFFSVDDWFIGTTEMDAGIPADTKAKTVTFNYNDLASVRDMFARHPGQIAAVFLEAVKEQPPRDNFLGNLKTLCHEHGAVLVFDEIINGFRLSENGGFSLYGVEPDLCCFGKAMANGFSVSALLGKRELMELGGIEQIDRDRVFLLSTTHGAESSGLAACLATIDTYRQRDVCGNLFRIGTQLRTRVNMVSRELGLIDHFNVEGHPSNLVYVTKDANRQRSQEFRTLFMQEMIRRGVLGPSFVVNEGHTDRDIDHTVWAVSEALHVYARALEEGVQHYLLGRSVKPVFRKRA